MNCKALTLDVMAALYEKSWQSVSSPVSLLRVGSNPATLHHLCCIEHEQRHLGYRNIFSRLREPFLCAQFLVGRLLRSAQITNRLCQSGVFIWSALYVNKGLLG